MPSAIEHHESDKKQYPCGNTLKSKRFNLSFN